MKQIGYVYDVEKKQYDKALAWYILAARENNAAAMDNIGCLYYKGFAVPKSYLCALKWQLKAVELNKNDNKVNNIGLYFQYGSGVPFDKYKALEWYCHSKIDVYTGKLKDEGYHLSEPDKSKFNSIIDSLC
jgi:TPR repeat protein